MPSVKQAIFILDDDMTLRKLLTLQLEEEEFLVVHCGTIAEAVRLLANQKFNCILLDVNIRGTTTEKLLHAIRENRSGYNFETPVIMLSGALEQEFVKRVARLIQGAVVKPFLFDTLLERVLEHCKPDTDS